LAKVSDVALAVAVLGIIGLIIYGGFSLSKWLSSLKLPNLGSLFGFGSSGSGGSSPFSTPSGEAFLLSSPLTAPLGLDLWAKQYLESMQKPSSYTAPASTSSYTAPTLTHFWQGGSSPSSITSEEAFLLSFPLTAPLGLDLWAKQYLESMQKPRSYGGE